MKNVKEGDIIDIVCITYGNSYGNGINKVILCPVPYYNYVEDLDLDEPRDCSSFACTYMYHLVSGNLEDGFCDPNDNETFEDNSNYSIEQLRTLTNMYLYGKNPNIGIIYDVAKYSFLVYNINDRKTFKKIKTPFERKLYEILNDARQKVIKEPHIRLGQAFYILLQEYNSKLADLICGFDYCDPFYTDGNIQRCIDKLIENGNV
ncbi:MAG: hypothetical protein RSE41_03635 [Clostridia bacterium]